MTTGQACFHCGEPVPAGVVLDVELDGERRPMCCRGCQAVARLIQASGLGRYYDFRDALPEPPDADGPRTGGFAAWDRAAVADHHAPPRADGRREITLVLENVHCGACAWLVQRYLGAMDGVVEARLDVADGRLRVVLDPEIMPLSAVGAALQRLGYPPHLDSPEAAADRDRSERRRMLRYLFVAGIGMMQVMSYALAGYLGAFQGIDAETERFFVLVSMLVAMPVALYAGQPFYRGAWRHLRRGSLGLDVPVAAAMLLALTASVGITFLDAGEVYFDSVVMFIFFLLLGRYAVMAARQGSGAVATALARALPGQALRRTDAGTEAVGVMELAPGDRVVVAAGEAVPADGDVVSGSGLVDESLLSGESAPRRRVPRERILAGSMLCDGHLELQVTGIGQDTVLAGIVDLLSGARRRRPRMVVLADRLAGAFIALVLTAAVVAAVAWWLVEPAAVIPVVLAMLVASCPCALALGTPTALAAATRSLARAGVLVAEPDALERLPAITDMVLDKTGTLTRPEMTVAEVRIAEGHHRDALERIAGRLERISRHPVASAFRAFDDGAVVAGARSVPGAGVSGVVDGVEWRLGPPQWIAAWLGRELQPPGIGTWLALARRDGLAGWFRLDNPLRSGARELVEDLQQAGIRVHLASGDRADNVAAIARELDIDSAHAGLQPADKLALLDRLRGAGGTVAMLGDGINDAPVLAGAHVSMALAEGAAIARTQADVVIAGRGLEPVAHLLALAPRVRRTIRQNLGWALAYNAAALPLAALGFLPPWGAALGMSASSLLVVLNARRAGTLPRRRRAASGRTLPVAARDFPSTAGRASGASRASQPAAGP